MHKKFYSEFLKGRNPPGMLRCKWDDNIKMVHKDVGCEGVDWIHLA
jgi:hypothetical protein